MNAPSLSGQTSRFDRLRLLALLVSHSFRLHLPKVTVAGMLLLLALMVATQISLSRQHRQTETSPLLDSALQDLLLQSIHLRLIDPVKAVKSNEKLKTAGFESADDLFRLLDGRLSVIESLSADTVPKNWAEQLRSEYKQLLTKLSDKQQSEQERLQAIDAWIGLLVPMINLNKTKLLLREKQVIEAANAMLWLSLGGMALGLLTLLCLQKSQSIARLPSTGGLEPAKTPPSRHIDHLTGLFNRAGWFHHCSAHLHRASLTERAAMTLAVVSIDDFEHFSETYSATQSDARICEAAELLRMNIRPGDLLARIAGGDFCLLLKNCTHSQATASLERIRTRASSRVQLSMGCCRVEASDSLKLLMLKADQALYKARLDSQIEYKKAPEIPGLLREQG